MSGGDHGGRPGGREWFADGLRFTCTQCGNCCTGPEGAVWVSDDEVRALARRFGVTEDDFRSRYARRLRGRWSLNEHRTEHGYDCVFLDRIRVPGKAVCGIYEHRPSQCRSWPFWPENLVTEAAWEATRRGTPCPGMGQGPLIPVEQIRIAGKG